MEEEEEEEKSWSLEKSKRSSIGKLESTVLDTPSPYTSIFFLYLSHTIALFFGSLPQWVLEREREKCGGDEISKYLKEEGGREQRNVLKGV